MAADEDMARQALAALPAFPAAEAATARITRLNGLTNHVFKVQIGDDAYALRIPRAIANSIIDRRAEHVSALAAAKAGVAPEVIRFADDGTMVTRYIRGAVPVSPERLRSDTALLLRVAAAFRRLHDEAPPFGRDFAVFAIADFYRDVLRRRGAGPSAEADAVRVMAEPIRAAFAAAPAALAPCHCDPTPANLLDDGSRIWLVDWEYAGNNDPMWDLAYLSVEADFDATADQRLLAAYFGRAPQPREAARMALNKPPCDLLGGLWALIQHAAGNPAADFAGEARRAFARAAERMAAPDFARTLDALRRR